jgi:hypothetical protein
MKIYFELRRIMTIKRAKGETNTRRDFLKTGLAAVIAGTSYFTFGGLREILAAAKKAGKPLLSAEGVNALVPSEPNDQYLELVKEALNDPLGFLKKNFYFTKIQDESLATVKAGDWENVRKTLQIVINKRYKIEVSVSDEVRKYWSTDKAEIANPNFKMALQIESSEHNGNSRGGRPMAGIVQHRLHAAAR